MGLSAFRGRPFEHTHENKAFDALYDLLNVHCAATSQSWLLLGNFYVGNRELDALVVKPNAVVIIDFKDFSGKLQFSEDGPWRIEGDTSGHSVAVKGGASVNPLVQLRINKRAVMDFLGRCFPELDERCNWGHTAALVVFQGSIEFDQRDIPGSIKPWFHVSDMERAVRDIEAIVSRELLLSAAHMNRFVAQLGLAPFVPAGELNTRILRKPRRQDAPSEPPLSPHQLAALAAFHAWLKGREGVFRLLGMASTGKRYLLPHLVNVMQSEGLEVVLLAPSARLSDNYANSPVEPVSIYTWVYGQGPDSFEQKDDRKIAVYPVKSDLDLRGKIPVLVDAHLLSDEEFDVVDRRYGSGRLISDFLWALSQEVPFVVIGDPYQMPRGALRRSLTAGTTLESAGLNVVVTQYLTEQIMPGGDQDALSTLQAHLVGSLDSNRFNQLPRLCGTRLETVEKGSTRKWKPDLHNLIPHSMYLCATHEQTARINEAVKTRFLHHASPTRLAAGDRVDFHSRTPILGPDDDIAAAAEIRWINAGEFALIDDVEPTIESHSISLRGRQQPIVLRFQRARCRIARLGQVEFRYLVDFFEAPRPELAPDRYLALQVLARQMAAPILDARKRSLPDKDDPGYKQARAAYDRLEYTVLQGLGYLSAARIRPAHALSLHRAQGRQWPCVWIDASRSASSELPGNQDYFRWLYTGSTCAAEQLVLWRLPALTPLSKAVISRAQNFAVGPMPTKYTLHYDKFRQPTAQEAMLPTPEGFDDVRFLPLLLELVDRFEGTAWSVGEWRNHAYQAVLALTNTMGSSNVRVRLHYDKNLTITNVLFLEGSDEGQQAVAAHLLRPVRPQDPLLAEAVDAVCDAMRDRGFTSIAGKETSYRAELTFASEEEAVELEVNSNKAGMVTSLRVLRATSENAAAAAEGLLINSV